MKQIFKKVIAFLGLCFFYLVVVGFSSNNIVVLYQYDKGVFEFNKETGGLITKFYKDKFKEDEADNVIIRIFEGPKKYLGSEKISSYRKLIELNNKYLKLAQKDSRDALSEKNYKIIRAKNGDKYDFYYLFSKAYSSFPIGNTKCLSSPGAWMYAGIDNPHIEISINEKIVFDKILISK